MRTPLEVGDAVFMRLSPLKFYKEQLQDQGI
jgi:hypothetical protein